MIEHDCHKPPVLAFRLQAELHMLVFLRFLAEMLVMVQPPKTPLHSMLFFFLPVPSDCGGEVIFY